MKFLRYLTFAYVSLAIVQSESQIVSNNKAFLDQASAQLDRLAPYRKSYPEKLPPVSQYLENPKKHIEATASEQRLAFEIYQILPEKLQKDIATRVGKNQEIVDLLDDPKYVALIQDRIKRSGTHRDGYEGYGDSYGGHNGYDDGSYGGGGYEKPGSDSGAALSGSGSIIGGLASGIIGGIVSASSGASKGSSSSGHSHKPEYGHGYSYEDKTFNVWDFKKAILNTLIQAIKAISGGVIALKGQLIKGGGYLVSTKGKIISTTGEAISSLGRHIASSAILSPPKHSSHPSHGYGHPSVEHVSHDITYDGPPPGVEEYHAPASDYHGHSSYSSPSDDDDHAGLLIVKPTKPDDHDDHHIDVDPRKPHLTQPTEETFDIPSKATKDKEVSQVVHGNLDSYHGHEDGNKLESEYSLDHPPPSYDSSNYYLLNDNKGSQTYPSYPPLNSEQPTFHPLDVGGPVSIQQSVEYPPLHVEQVRYSLPTKSLASLELPKGSTSSNDLSLYSSVSIGLNPPLDSIKISTIKHGGKQQLPHLQHLNVHGLTPVDNVHSGITSQEPLKIPILSPLPAHYWHNHGLVQPITNFGVHGLHRRRSILQRRRTVADLARYPFLVPMNTRLHRVD